MVWRRAAALAAALLLLLGHAAGAAGAVTTDELIRFHQGRVGRDPDDALAYARLGAAYIQKARESGDITYHDLAEKALRASLRLLPEGPTATSATTSLALVHLARHQFADALALAQRAVALGSGELYPYAVLGDAYLEIGEDEQASLAYARMQTLTGPLYPHARLADLAFLRGEPEHAIEHMRRALAALEVPAAREHVAWSQARLAELFFHTGDLARAEAASREALASDPGFHRALAMLARVRVGQRRFGDAIELSRKALAVIPLPEYAALLGDVLAKVGRALDAKKQYELVEYIGGLSRINKAVYNRELALFYADHDLKPKEAVDLAEKELQIRRDVYTWNVVAWTRFKHGQLTEARAAMKQALRLGTRDARLFFHAGMIHLGLGEREEARQFLRRAVATNPYFDVLQADRAAATLKRLDADAR